VGRGGHHEGRMGGFGGQWELPRPPRLKGGLKELPPRKPQGIAPMERPLKEMPCMGKPLKGTQGLPLKGLQGMLRRGLRPMPRMRKWQGPGRRQQQEDAPVGTNFY